MNLIDEVHNILKDSKFFNDFKDCKILYSKSGKLLKSVSSIKNNINRLSKDIDNINDRLKFLGDAWEFFTFFYMAYERNLICKNIDKKYKKFKINDIKINSEDFGTDFYILHNNETISVQSKFKTNNEDLDPRKAKLANFIQDSRSKTDSKYYILFTTNDLKYTIKNELIDNDNFYVITLEDIDDDNIGIDIIKEFENCILCNNNKCEIIKQEIPNDLIDLKIEPSICDSDISNFCDVNISSVPINIFKSTNIKIQTLIIYFIIKSYYSYLGIIRFDVDSNCWYTNSEKYNKTFVFKYFYSKQDQLSANSMRLSSTLNLMDDGFGLYESKIIIISNVSMLYDTSFLEMSRNKIYSIINYKNLPNDITSSIVKYIHNYVM